MTWTIIGDFRLAGSGTASRIIGYAKTEEDAYKLASAVLDEDGDCALVYISNGHGKGRFITRD